MFLECDRCEIRFKEQNGVITKMNKLYKEYCKWYLQPELNAKSQNSRQYWQYLLYENAGSGPSTVCFFFSILYCFFFYNF